MNIDVVGHFDTPEGLTEMRCRLHRLSINGAVIDDVLGMVDVVEEEIQRRDALDETGLDMGPLGAGNDPGHQVERKNPPGPLIIAIHREGDPLLQEGGIRPELLRGEFLRRHPVDRLHHGFVMGTDLPGGGENFIKKRFGSVVLKKGRHEEVVPILSRTRAN